ncbi:28S ribosomal protein S7, mitochondrial [Solea senegalensis]|uniref:Small ribosomal subunit protein uS7m n=1 Tax=Solea senegalensis TaxID=28829 RepID=A0AAV6RHG7_SOLSE|nr:28S ribosomal protein S7, mitochondrial [Solea senegalensis]KAG7504818.1 28S ribosomal protein S7, mitochondrial [Solea senegalensis]
MATMSGLLKPWLPRVFLVRWSRYNPYYLEPDVRKETYSRPEAELTAEEKEQQQLKVLRPIKAATNGVTSSVFSDPVISKFINMMMKHGDKILAREIMTQTLESIKRIQVEKYHKAPEVKKEEIECNPYTIFHQALENCKPVVGLASIQKGGKYYQVPVPLTDNRRRFLAMKWMMTECRDNKHRRTRMYEKLSQELLAAYMKEGNVIKKKHELHKMAESNRAYAHYRWW